MRISARQCLLLTVLGLIGGPGWTQPDKALTAGDDTGDRLFKSGRFEEAAEHYRQLEQREPGKPAILLRLGDCYYRLGRFAEAGMNFEKALTAGPESQAALLGVGKCRVALGQSREAIPYLTKAHKLAKAHKMDPDDREAARMLAVALHEVNRVEEAEALLAELVQSDPADTESWYLLGYLRYYHGYFAAALEAIDKSMARPSGNAKLNARIYRSICLVQVGRSQEAEDEIIKLLNHPDAAKNADLLTAYAQVLYETGRLDEALKRIDQAISASPGVSKDRFWRARILFRMNRLDDAAREAENAVRLSPRFPFARNLLVKIYTIQGRTGDAARQADWLREFEDKKTLGK